MAAGLAVSPDNRHLLTGTWGTDTLLWDITTGELLQRFDDAGFVTNGISYSPDGQFAVISSDDLNERTPANSLVVWDVESGQEVSRFEHHRYYTYARDFSPDGKHILSGSFSTGYGEIFGNPDVGDLFLWETATGEIIHEFDYDGDVSCINFSADGNRALVGQWGGATGEVTLWDVDLDSPTFGDMLHQSPNFGPVMDCQYGLDETTYIMASNDGNIYERDIISDDVIRTFVGHDGWVMRLDISTDYRYMISGDSVGVVILWELATGEELRRFDDHTRSTWDIAFSPDGQYAFSSSYDGSVIQWQIADWTLDDLLAWIPENRYVHELTCEERTQYNVEPLCK